MTKWIYKTKREKVAYEDEKVESTYYNIVNIQDGRLVTLLDMAT